MTSRPTNWVNCCSRCRVEFSWVQLSCVAINGPLRRRLRCGNVDRIYRSDHARAVACLSPKQIGAVAKLIKFALFTRSDLVATQSLQFADCSWATLRWHMRWSAARGMHPLSVQRINSVTKRILRRWSSSDRLPVSGDYGDGHAHPSQNHKILLLIWLREKLSLVQCVYFTLTLVQTDILHVGNLRMFITLHWRLLSN